MIKFYDRLSNDLTDLLENEYDYNVIVKIGKVPNFKPYKAHAAILYQRSTLFRRELGEAEKDENSIKEIRVDYITPEIFDIIIKYIYGGYVSLDNMKTSIMFELMSAANDFGLIELAKHIQSHMIEHNANWLCLNFARAHRISFRNEHLQELNQFCVNISSKYPDLVFNSRDFTSLHENVLVSIVGHDNSEMDETSIFERIIEWALAQNPKIPPSPDDWSENDILTIKSALKNCLPRIRYSRINADDIFNKIRPYQQILDEDIWADLMKRYMAPPKPPKSPSINPTTTHPRGISITIPQSKSVSSHSHSTEQLSREIDYSLKISSSHSLSAIVTDEQIAEISSWIDGRSSPFEVSNNPYEFQLILRGSCNGFNYKTFWNLCDKQSHTVVILKINGCDEILGGYNPLEWDKQKYRGWSKTDKSFIFKIGTENSPETILSKVQNPDQAIFESYYDGNGPNFGGTALRMKDDFKEDKSCVCMGHKGYEKPIRTSKATFSVDEYEVFKVINKFGLKIPE